MVFAFGIWGYHVGGTVLLKWLLGLGLPLVTMVLWGMFMAPRADHRIDWPWLPIIAGALFLLAALALYASGYKTHGIAVAVLAIINTVLVFLWQQK